MPTWQPDGDTVRVVLSPGRYAEPIPGGYQCTSCGDVHVTQDDLPKAKAMNWLTQHHCEPPGPIEEIGD